MIPGPATRARLAELGIDMWVRRDRAAAKTAPEAAERPESAPQSQRSGRPASRIRLASGDGDWLLVQDAPWDGRHDALLGDIQATIGSARCRFGHWAHSDSAGVAVDELGSRGVRHVLVFGDSPVDPAHDAMVVAPPLAELASRAEARRRLWQLLSERLDD